MINLDDYIHKRIFFLYILQVIILYLYIYDYNFKILF